MGKGGVKILAYSFTFEMMANSNGNFHFQLCPFIFSDIPLSLKMSSASGGLHPPESLPWTPLENFYPPDPLLWSPKNP